VSGGKDIRLVEGVDYYFENGLMVFTAYYLARRGFCCNNGCRHCPYGDNPPTAPAIRILGVDPGSDKGTGS
jgi:hypothetical protein